MMLSNHGHHPSLQILFGNNSSPPQAELTVRHFVDFLIWVRFPVSFLSLSPLLYVFKVHPVCSSLIICSVIMRFRNTWKENETRSTILSVLFKQSKSLFVFLTLRKFTHS
jgi:hypothetical protein